MLNNCTKKLFIIFAIITLVFGLSSSNAESNAGEMPYVLIGGDTVFADYTNEPLTYSYESEEAGENDLIERDLNVVQIGRIPILCIPDVEIAAKAYVGKTVPIKEYINGKLFERSYFVYDTEQFTKSFTYQITASGKVCFYIPERNIALLYGHPITTGKCGGIIYEGKAIGLSDDGSINSIKTPKKDNNAIGIIIDQNNYGVVMQYDPDRISETHQKIQIARKDEVHLGKAYIYTDYGKGLNTYEIEIISLTRENEADKENQFVFQITDHRLISDDVTEVAPGMSGSPIIQDDKLIGFNAYSDISGGAAVYACSAYEEVIDRLTSKEAPYESLKSDDKHPLVLVGHTFIAFYMKDIGVYISKIDGEDYGLKKFDKVIAIDDKMLLVGTNLTETIKEKHVKSQKIKLTILRDGKILDIYLTKKQNPIITNYNYNNIGSGYISMVNPINYRYAFGSFNHTLGSTTPFSGITWESTLDIEGSPITARYDNEVIGTFTDSGYEGYGFIDPFSYEDDKLVEVAFRNEVENGEAEIYVYDMSSGEYLYKVRITVKKSDQYLDLSLSDSPLTESFNDVNIPGLPIIQNGRLIGVYAATNDDGTKGKAYYAIDVYNEMMNIK